MPERAARRAALDTQLALAQRVPEAGVVGVRPGRGRGSPIDPEQHRARRVADRAADERDLGALPTWLQAVPRSWRTASGRWFTPCTNASAVRAAVGVDRQRAVGPAGRAALDERAAVAHRAEAVLLERERHRDRERLDDQRDVDVGEA